MMAETAAPVEVKSPPRSKKGVVWLLSIAVVALALSAWKFKVTGQPPFLHRENVWSVAMYEGDSPTDLRPVSERNQPLLVATDVSDVDALFVADPFMVKQDDTWYMFVEILNKQTNQGDIALATSTDDGKTWSYQATVLDEPWHLSYPSVFQWQDRWYMLPQGDTGVHLYEAAPFPSGWKK